VQDAYPTPSPNPPSPSTPAAQERAGLRANTFERSRSNQPTVVDGRKHRKLGPWLLFLIFTSLLVLGISAGFLAWIWFGSRDEERWRTLMTGNFSTRAITLTAVLIRYAVGTLAWISGAMMMSIILERHSVPLDKIAQASIARYTGSVLAFALRGLYVVPWSIFTFFCCYR
jgi:hypothetical protein